MGANGNRRQTLRTNIVQPYESGFLTDTDHKDYNAVVGIELDKISTSTKHMFQGLDDVRKEVEDRTKALDALHLTVNDQFNRVMLEISGIKLQIGQGITVDNIYDSNGNSLAGTLEGIKTDVNTANANITNILGEITNTNFRFDGEITSIKTDLGVVQNQIGFMYGPEGAQALWTVHETVNGVTASIGLVTTVPNNKDPINSEFYVKADAFNVYTKDGTGAYQTNPMLSVTSSGIFLGDNIYIKGAYVSGDIQSTTFTWTAPNFKGWKLQPDGQAFFGDTAHFAGTMQSYNYTNGGSVGWSITPDGLAKFNNVVVRGEIQATTGSLDNVIINSNCTILGTLSANNIVGDIGDFLINSTESKDQDLTNDSTLTGRLFTIRQQDFEQKVSVLGNLLMDDKAGSLTTIVYQEVGGNPTDRLDTAKCSIGSVMRWGMGAGGTGTGSYFTLMAGSQQIFRQNSIGYATQDSFSFTVPAGTGNIDVTWEIHNASNATTRAQIIARYHVFTQRRGSVITR